MFESPSDEVTFLPVEVVVFWDLGLEEPPDNFHISYSTLEAKKSAACRIDTIEVFCLELSWLLKK